MCTCWIVVLSAVERIARRAPQYVNVAKDDGFTALHLAALNGYIKTATVLLDTVSITLLSFIRQSKTVGLLFN